MPEATGCSHGRRRDRFRLRCSRLLARVDCHRFVEQRIQFAEKNYTAEVPQIVGPSGRLIRRRIRTSATAVQQGHPCGDIGVTVPNAAMRVGSH